MEYRTSVRAEARGMSNIWVVEIVGKSGTCKLYRRSYEDAMATARWYATLLDSPRSVI